jgi:surfeit locus 1 family protein
MRLRVGNRAFAPRWWAIPVAAAAIAACLALGTWQLGRAREKQALIDAFDRGQQTSVDLGSRSVDPLPRYQHVTIRGYFDPSRQVLLDNMPSSTGQAGYRVLTPFVRPGSAKLLLVDRGWLPLGLSRERLPDVTVTGELRETGGRLDQLPVPGVRIGAADVPGDRQWPRVLFFPRVADLEQALEAPVESRIVLLDADRPDGYERVWRPALEFPPERHLGYAVQWFALAVVVFITFVALSVTRISPPDTPRP